MEVGSFEYGNEFSDSLELQLPAQAKNYQMKYKPRTWLRLQIKLCHTNVVKNGALLDSSQLLGYSRNPPPFMQPMLTGLLQWYIICTTSIHSKSSNNFPLKSILLISYHLCPGLPTANLMFSASIS